MSTVIRGHDGTDTRPVKVTTAGRPEIEVTASALPSGAATEDTLATRASEATLSSINDKVATAAKQDTIITELQRANWGKVLDAGMAFSEVSSGGGNVNATPLVVPDGQTYVLTAAWGVDWSSATSGIAIYINNGDTYNCFLVHVTSTNAGESVTWTGNIVLPSGYQVIVRFYGTTSGDTLNAACMWHRIA